MVIRSFVLTFGGIENHFVTASRLKLCDFQHSALNGTASAVCDRQGRWAEVNDLHLFSPLSFVAITTAAQAGCLSLPSDLATLESQDAKRASNQLLAPFGRIARPSFPTAMATL